MLALVVVAHPSTDSYCRVLATRAQAGLRSAGHEVAVLDLYELGFRTAMTPDERHAYHGDSPILDPMVAEHAALVQRAEAIVFVYPTWWSGLPAMLKGWLERVLVPGVGFVLDERTNKVRPGLGQMRRLVGISTYGSPKWYVRIVNDNGRRIVTRRAAHELWTSGADHLARALRDRHVHGSAAHRVPRPSRTTDGGAAMTRALVVYCHPSEESFVAAVRDRVVTGLATAGAEVRLTDLYTAGFDPAFSAAERANHLVAGTDPSIESYGEDLRWCDTLVLVYPRGGRASRRCSRAGSTGCG